MRCPYAFYQLYTGALRPQDAIDALGAQLIGEGIEFEDQVAAIAEPLPPGTEFPDVINSRSRFFRPPVLANEALRLRGAPDAIDAADGALLPIEIKSHKDVRRIDELELAFYWLVLEAHRTRHISTPRGQLILRRDGSPYPLDIEISPERFEEVRHIISDVRSARRNGVLPRVCGCSACRGPLRDQIERATRSRKDLTMIFGIAYQRARMLEAMGVSDYDALLQTRPDEIIAHFRAERRPVSEQEVIRWQQHAECYRRGNAHPFRPFPSLGDRFLVLDLEYEPVAADIWLIGACHVTPDRVEYVAFWSNSITSRVPSRSAQVVNGRVVFGYRVDRRCSPTQQKKALAALQDLLLATDACPVVTWNGLGADLPVLTKASERLGCAALLDLIRRRHVDLYD